MSILSQQNHDVVLDHLSTADRKPVRGAFSLGLFPVGSKRGNMYRGGAGKIGNIHDMALAGRGGLWYALRVKKRELFVTDGSGWTTGSKRDTVADRLGSSNFKREELDCRFSFLGRRPDPRKKKGNERKGMVV